MSETRPEDESLKNEFETLGRNLIEALRASWDAPESRRFRDEVAGGLIDLGSTLKREAEHLATSPVAQKVQNSVEDVGEKLRAPEMQNVVRRELIGALQMVNTELQKVIAKWSPTAATDTQTDVSGSAAPHAEMDVEMPASTQDIPDASVSDPAPSSLADSP